jgi:hypothetical protein
MKYILSILIIGLLLISACSTDTIKARPFDEQKSIDIEIDVKEDLCDDVNCSENSYCVSGECICRAGFKDCNGECIEVSACCSNSDCGQSEVCESQACVKHVCGFYEVYDSKKDKCVCSDDSQWCSAKKKCIPKNHCCSHANCGNSYRCAETSFLAFICVDDGRKRCRSVLEGYSVRFYIKGIAYDVLLKSVSENFASIKINELELNDQALNVPYHLRDDATLYIESTTAAGGACKSLD